MQTDAMLYSIVQGNTILIDGITEIMIDAVAGDSVALSSRTATSVKKVSDIVRWIDRGRAVIREP